MAQTTQTSSRVSLNKEGKDLNTAKPEAEDNVSLLLSLFDSLNKLQERLNRLDYVIQRKQIEQISKK